MAERTLTLTIADVRALGDRLYARGGSKLYYANSEGYDLCTAARVIWRFAEEFSSPASTITIQADD